MKWTFLKILRINRNKSTIIYWREKKFRIQLNNQISKPKKEIFVDWRWIAWKRSKIRTSRWQFTAWNCFRYEDWRPLAARLVPRVELFHPTWPRTILVRPCHRRARERSPQITICWTLARIQIRRYPRRACYRFWTWIWNRLRGTVRPVWFWGVPLWRPFTQWRKWKLRRYCIHRFVSKTTLIPSLILDCEKQAKCLGTWRWKFSDGSSTTEFSLR